MAKYATKTCYDCGIQNPANLMERVTESYNSGRSDRRPDGVNVAAFLLSDAATSRKMIKGAVTKNNRRSYTRNRTVWKCLDCSGHNASVQRAEEAKRIAEERKVARVEAAQRKEREKAYKKANKHKNPLHPFKKFLSWSTLITCGSMLSVVGMASIDISREGETDILAGLVASLVIFGIPMAISIKALWFREYNRLIRQEKKA